MNHTPTVLDEITALIESGKFHHATYRDFGKCWEGLHIYEKSESGFRGFRPALIVGKNDPLLPQAEQLVARFGTSVGSYGEG